MQVGLLSRNIVIRAENEIAYDKTNNGNRKHVQSLHNIWILVRLFCDTLTGEESFAFGCALWAKDYSLFRLQGVELAGCGQKHVRAAVTIAKCGHLQVAPDGESPAYMRHCSVHHSSDHGVEVRGGRREGNSRNPLPVFELSNNVIFESARAGVAVPGGAVNVHNNLAVNSGLSASVVSRLYVFNRRDSAAFQVCLLCKVPLLLPLTLCMAITRAHNNYYYK